MPPNGYIDPYTRAAIITLRCEGRGWTYISRKVANCSPYGVQRFFERVLQRADLGPDTASTQLPLPLLLTLLEDPHDRGREERFSEFSEVADTLVNTALQDETHEELPHKEVIGIASDNLDIYIPYTTGRDVLRRREVVKRAPPRKIRLDRDHQNARLLFAEWALAQPMYIIWVFTDETIVQSTQHRKRNKVSIQKGDNVFNQSRPPAREFKSVMFWGAICEGFSPGPFYIWEKETSKEALHNQAILQDLNTIAVEQENFDRRQALIPGTVQQRALQELNNEVNRLDRDCPLPSGRQRRQRRPEWHFKQERAERDKSKGGIDWLRYREQILKPILYPWAFEISQLTQRQVYIIEDNAGVHAKAKRWSKDLRSQYNGWVKCVDWPALSPDLNRIERIWDSLKDDFEKLRSAQLSRMAIKDRLIESWRSTTQSKIDIECRRFRSILQKVKENDGNNNFYG